jgi:hypothetical protein
MININENKKLVEFIANKHQSGASLSPDEYNLCVRSSLDDIIMYYYGLPQHYAPGMPLPAVAWEVTQLVSDYLSGLKKTNVLAVDADGHAPYPSDYMHKSVLTYEYISQTSEVCDNPDKPVPSIAQDDCETEEGTLAQKQSAKVSTTSVFKPVTVLTDEQFATAINSQVRKPSKKYPVCRFMNDHIEFAPKDLGSVTMVHIRYPLTPVWGYTNPTGFFAIYDPTTSVNIELPAILNNQVAYSVLTKLGINIREQQLQAFAQQMKAQGV